MPLGFQQPRRASTAKPAQRMPDWVSTASALSRCAPTSGDAAWSTLTSRSAQPPHAPERPNLPASAEAADSPGRGIAVAPYTCTTDAARWPQPSPHLAKRHRRPSSAPSTASPRMRFTSSSATGRRPDPTSANSPTRRPRRRNDGAKYARPTPYRKCGGQPEPPSRFGLGFLLLHTTMPVLRVASLLGLPLQPNGLNRTFSPLLATHRHPIPSRTLSHPIAAPIANAAPNCAQRANPILDTPHHANTENSNAAIEITKGNASYTSS